MYPCDTVRAVLDLAAAGLSDYEIARRTGISRGTVFNWRHGRRAVRSSPPSPCPRCDDPQTFRARLGFEYSYLLAQYLVDGCSFPNTTSYTLRISSDARYGDIISECCRAIETLCRRSPKVRHDPAKRLVNILSYWKLWPCLLPQHGPGRKHARPIQLVRWQTEIVEDHPGRFLRGLIHSDGWRGLNRVTVKGRDYAYPRYQFSNRSDDIRALFTYACDLVGIEWRPWGRWHISVARRASVARLDEFVGPKS
jgi:Homeodomain-like domain